MNLIKEEPSNNLELLKIEEEILLNSDISSDKIIELQSINILANDSIIDIPELSNNNSSKNCVHVPVKLKNKQKNNYLIKIIYRFSFIIPISIVQVVIFYTLNKNIYEHIVYVPFKKQQEFWRLLTYGFIHDNHLHLWLNIIYQIFFGIPLEIEQNSIKISIVYVVGIIIGALGTSHFHINEKLIGSSAGVYSLFASHMSHLILNFGTLSYKYFRIYCFGVLCLSDFMYSIYIIKFNPDSIISIVVHYYGAATGIFIGFSIYSQSSKLTKLIFIILTFSWIIFINVWHS